MVKLNKIYTRTGDAGETSLVNGMRVSKHARRPSAFGEVDEANSVIGLARLHTGDIADADAMLARIQNDLFDLGADIATPETDKPALRITSEQVTRLETEIDMMNAKIYYQYIFLGKFWKLFNFDFKITDDKKKSIGIIGFEPMTSCSQSRHSTKLSYIPTNYFLSIKSN